MGAVASRANMSSELFDAANAVFSGVRGALAAATIGSCAAFSAICGSSIATAATFSKVAIPQMRRYGYDMEMATGAVASAGTLGTSCRKMLPMRSLRSREYRDETRPAS